ncbi:hypothetical protein T492DRAFT_1121764 [Pavlovales sp. CCMP2436]|nr:hypothetical protein T492DRAFT_1121764 [Pavlovales sp. CCMP2436]
MFVPTTARTPKRLERRAERGGEEQNLRSERQSVTPVARCEGRTNVTSASVKSTSSTCATVGFSPPSARMKSTRRVTASSSASTCTHKHTQTHTASGSMAVQTVTLRAKFTADRDIRAQRGHERRGCTGRNVGGGRRGERARVSKKKCGLDHPRLAVNARYLVRVDNPRARTVRARARGMLLRRTAKPGLGECGRRGAGLRGKGGGYGGRARDGGGVARDSGGSLPGWRVARLLNASTP